VRFVAALRVRLTGFFPSLELTGVHSVCRLQYVYGLLRIRPGCFFEIMVILP
jgi:hypothetical protein